MFHVAFAKYNGETFAASVISYLKKHRKYKKFMSITAIKFTDYNSVFVPKSRRILQAHRLKKVFTYIYTF